MLQTAEGSAKQFGDDYVSTEHLLIGVMDAEGTPAAKLLTRHGVTRDKVFAALTQIRGSQRVTDPNPEVEISGAGEVRPRSDRATPVMASSTRSSAATRRFGASSRSSLAAQRTIRS